MNANNTWTARLLPRPTFVDLLLPFGIALFAGFLGWTLFTASSFDKYTVFFVSVLIVVLTILLVSLAGLGAFRRWDKPIIPRDGEIHIGSSFWNNTGLHKQWLLISVSLLAVQLVWVFERLDEFLDPTVDGMLKVLGAALCVVATGGSFWGQLHRRFLLLTPDYFHYRAGRLEMVVPWSDIEEIQPFSRTPRDHHTHAVSTFTGVHVKFAPGRAPATYRYSYAELSLIGFDCHPAALIDVMMRLRESPELRATVGSADSAHLMTYPPMLQLWRMSIGDTWHQPAGHTTA